MNNEASQSHDGVTVIGIDIGTDVFHLIGRHLQVARTLGGVKQRQLAQAAGFHPNAVKYWGRDESRIGGRAVRKMVEALAAAGATAGEENLGCRSVAVLRG